jgi:hypothetical protein
MLSLRSIAHQYANNVCLRGTAPLAISGGVDPMNRDKIDGWVKSVNGFAKLHADLNPTPAEKTRFRRVFIKFNALARDLLLCKWLGSDAKLAEEEFQLLGMELMTMVVRLMPEENDGNHVKV